MGYREQIEQYLAGRGYTKMPSSMEEVSVAFRVDGRLVMAVMVIDSVNIILSEEGFRQAEGQVGSIFHSRGYSNIKILSVILVSNRANSHRLADTNNNVWLVDESRGALMIFENSIVDFDELRLGLEECLGKTHVLEDGGSGDGGAGGSPPGSVFKRFRDMFLYGSAPAATCLVLLNIAVFIALSITGSTEDAAYMIEKGALYAPCVFGGNQFFRLFTSMFMHFGIEHLTANMLALYVFGSRVEPALGEKRFLMLYLYSGLAGSSLSLAAAMVTGTDTVSAGASGAIFGVIGALFSIVIKNRGKFRDITASRAALMIGYSLFLGLTSQGIDNAAHLGGLLVGLLGGALLYTVPQS